VHVARQHLLLYDYVPDILERRGAHREAHLAAIRAAQEAGHVTMAGPLGDPPTGAAIVFEGGDAETAAQFARQDPYVIAGLVTHWRVEPWTLVS
jgi:uncharacterized protein YciI